VKHTLPVCHPSAQALEELLQQRGYRPGWPAMLPQRARIIDMDLGAHWTCEACGYTGAMQARAWHKPFTGKYTLCLCCLHCGGGVLA
jgi:hypothetical protein